MNASLENAERLSAFLDGELAATDVDSLLDALDNPACRQQMLRFSVREQVAQGAQLPQSAVDDLGMRLRPQLQAQGAQTAPKRSKLRWREALSAMFQPAVWVPAGGVAASALVAVLAWQLSAPVPQQDGAEVATLAPPAPQAQATSSVSPASLPVRLVAAPAALPSQASAPSAARELVIPAPEGNKEIEQLYLQHARFRGGHLLSSPAAFARIGVQPTVATKASAKTDP